jgi:hypothetical protein
MKKLLAILILINISCNKAPIPREYRKMQKRVERREKIERREKTIQELENDTNIIKWTPLKDSVLMGTPKL